MKGLLIVVLLALLLYVAAAVLLYSLQRKFIFHPTPVVSHPFDERELIVSAGSDRLTLKLIVLNPGMPEALLYFGGNAESLAASAEPLAQQISGRTVYLAQYRGYAGSGGEPTQSALFADAVALYDEIAGQHTAVAALGRSLGSGVVCWLATQRPLASLVLVTPYDSILQLARDQYPLFPIAWMLKDPFESSRYAAQIEAPVLVMTAADDTVIPAQSTVRLIDAFGRPVSSREFTGSTHNDIQLQPGYYEMINEFLADGSLQ